MKPTRQARQLQDLVQQYALFIEANRAAVRSLNELGKILSDVTRAAVRGNEPFSIENITHRCSKKRNLEAICSRLGRRLLLCASKIETLIDSFGAITEGDTTEIRSTLGDVKEHFLAHFWFLKRLLLFDLCDDVMYFSQQKRAMRLLTDISPDISKSIPNLQDQTVVTKLRSFNEVIRYLHHRGEAAFFIRAREMGGSRQFALGNDNILNLVDLDAELAAGSAAGGGPLDRVLTEPVMSGLLRPYLDGIKGQGAELLNVVKFKDTIDTQLELGHHKARLRSRVTPKSGPANSFISLSYFEPFQALVSQTLGQRVRYFAGILSRLGFRLDTDFVTFLTASFRGAAGKCKTVLGELMRAMISLKDLDELLSIPGRIDEAVSLFCEGVSNLHGYFNVLRCLEFALSGQISLTSLELILKQEDLNKAEISRIIEHDLPELAKRPNVNSETVEMLKSIVSQLKNAPAD